MRSTRRFWLAGVIALACLVLAVPGRAFADDPALTVYVIHGSNSGDGVEGPIKDIVRRMGNAGSMFDSYRLVKKEQASVAVGATKKIALPGQRQVVLKPTGINGDTLNIEAAVAKRGSSGTTVRGKIVRGGTFVFAGYSHEGGQLFFAINARF